MIRRYVDVEVLRNVGGYVGAMKILLTWTWLDPLAVTLEFVDGEDMDTGAPCPRWIISRDWLTSGGCGGKVGITRSKLVRLRLGEPGQAIVFVAEPAEVDAFLQQTYAITGNDDDPRVDEAIDHFIRLCLSKPAAEPDTS